jgi:S-adenosylmethionine:tRNA-ribosyltransferase-isomerase (queuine synthetase)
MKKSDFYFDLPEELIAQTPLERRDASRLLTLDKTTGAVAHHHFYELPQFLRPNDCLVLNDSRVLPARLLGHRSTGGAVEVLLLRDLGDGKWECLTRPGRKTQPGTALSFGDGELTATVVDAIADGNSFTMTASFWRCSSGWAKCRCRRTSRQSCRIRSATRRSIPASLAAPPRRQPACTSRRSCCSGSRTWV